MKKSTFFRFYPLLTLMFFNFQDTLIAQTCVNNLLQNPGFESNLSSWQTALAEIATTPVASGTKSLKLCTQSGSATQTLAATAGKTYKIQYSAKTAGTNQNVLFGLKFLSASWQVLGSDYSSFDSPTSFTSNSIQKLAPTGTAWVEVAIYKQNNGCIYVDDMCLTESGVNPNPCSPDVTAPVIANCPANVNVTANVGATLAAVQWIAPTTTDNCTGTVNLTSTHPIGSNFPIGSTTVTYTAKDVANNSATCSFIVTVTSQNAGNGCVGNLLGNSGFESNNFDSWGIVGNPTIVAGGNGTSAKAVLLSPPSAYRIYQLKPATVGKVYEMRAFAKTTVSMSVGILAIKFFDASWNLIGDDITTTFSPTANFLEYSVNRVAPLGAVYIEATALGNTGSVLFDDFCLLENINFNPCLYDSNPPHFDSCPLDISLSTENNSAIVTYTEPHATDECEITLTSNIMGNDFPIGTNNVVYTAKDIAGNSSICSFTIQVIKDQSSCTDSPDINCPIAISKTIDVGELLGIDPLSNGNYAVYLEKNGLYFVTRNEIDKNGNLVKSEIIETDYKKYTVENNIVYFSTEIFKIPTSLTNFYNFGLVEAKRNGTNGWYIAGRSINANFNDSIYVFELDNSLNILKKRSLPNNDLDNYFLNPNFLIATNFGYIVGVKTPVPYFSAWTTLWFETGATDLIKKDFFENLISIKKAPFGTNLYLITSDSENRTFLNYGLSTGEYRRNKTLYEFSGQNNTDFKQIQNHSLVVNFGFFNGNIVSRNEKQIAENVASGFLYKNFNGIYTKTNLSNNTVVSTYNLPCKLIGAFPFENTDGSLAFFKRSNSLSWNFYKSNCSTNTNTGSDLEITMTANKTSVAQWNDVTYTINAKNTGNAPISAAVVKVGGCSNGTLSLFDNVFKLVYAGIPAAPTAGNYNYVTQDWTINNLAAGQQGVLTLKLFSTGTGEKKVIAFAKTQSPNDPDSQPAANPPANCAPTQDDEAVWTINQGQQLLASGVRAEDSDEEILFFEKIGFLSDYTLFPNPATEMVYIKMNTLPSDGVTQIHAATTIKLLNQLGKVEKLQEFSSINEDEIHEFSLQDVSNGVYFMQIETAGKRAVVKKLVVSRMY
jgi:hypothetical protein